VNAPETETASRVTLPRMHLSLLRRAQCDLELHLGIAEGYECTPQPTPGSLTPRRGLPAFMEWVGRCTRSYEVTRQKTYHQGRPSLGEEALEVILISRDDIAALCGDGDVRAALECVACGWRISLDCDCRKTHCLFPRFPFLKPFSRSSVLRSFLDDLYCIAHRDYEPTDEDIVCVRLWTVGVQEYLQS
jgi:hypothetical protein